MNGRYDFFSVALVSATKSTPIEEYTAPCQVFKSTDIQYILSHAQFGSLVALDIDDTVGRVSQTVG